MSGYNIQSFIRNFADRTQYNYEFVKKESSHRGPYEVTQLINSLFGLIIVPNEKYKNIKKRDLRGRNKIITSIADDIYEIIDRCKKEGRYRNNYGQRSSEKIALIRDVARHLRNSIAHGGNEGLHFLPIAEGEEITDVVFYDTDGIGEFCIKLTIDEIKELVDLISKFYINVETIHYSSSVQKKYENELKLLDDFMKSGRGEGEKTVAEKIKEIDT